MQARSSCVHPCEHLKMSIFLIFAIPVGVLFHYGFTYHFPNELSYRLSGYLVSSLIKYLLKCFAYFRGEHLSLKKAR